MTAATEPQRTSDARRDLSDDDPLRAFPGGARLQPAHFEPSFIPAEVARYGTDGAPLRVGSPGKVGILELGFERRGQPGRERTELVHHYQKVPLQIMRPLYYEEARPDIPYTYLMTTGGGVLHGDRHRTDLRFGPHSAAHVTTQAHTKIYRMKHGFATALVNLHVDHDAYVEYLPDPVIPYDRSRYYQRTHAQVDPTATLVLGETLYAGRLSRGERHEYDVYAADLVVDRPDGEPVVIDRARLVPGTRPVERLGVLGHHDIVSTLYVVSPLVEAKALADQFHEALRSVDPDLLVGVGVLPGDHGAWLRMVGDDTVTMARATREAWQLTRLALTGTAAPKIRK